MPINSDTDTVNGLALILVAGGFLHVTFDDNAFGLGIGGKGDLGVDVDAIAISEVNGFQQLGVADDAADFNLVLQRQIALVDNAKRGQLICTAGLPKNLRA